MAHDVNATMLYIHPPLAILGYVLIVASVAFLVAEVKRGSGLRRTKSVLYISWIFNFLGIITGSIWAYSAWGSPWSWDPKETVSLLMFVFLVLSLLAYDEPLLKRDLLRSARCERYYEWRSDPAAKRKSALVLAIMCLLMMCVNITITLGNLGLHSYGFF